MITAPAAARAPAISTTAPPPIPRRSAEGAAARLRRGGPAAPVMTLLTMLDIARVARARAPGQEAQERARLNAAAAAVAAAEQRWSLPHPDNYVPDERNAAWRAIPNGTRGEVEAAYRLYRSQVEAWQQARALTAFTRAWVEDLELAAERYIEASLEFGQTMVRDGAANRPPFEERGSAVAAYRRWLACYAPVLEGNPARAGDLVCERLRAMRSDLSLRRAALLASAGARPRASYFRLLQVDQYLGGLVEDVVVGLAGLSDRAFGELLEEALAPAPVNAARLNAAFEEGAERPTHLPLRRRLDRRRSRHARAARRRCRLRQCAAHAAPRSIPPASRRSTTRSSSPGSPCSIRAASGR